MGFYRQGMPASLDRAAVRSVVVGFVSEYEIALLLREADPFLIENDCESPYGHDFKASCGDVVCVHCGKVAWR